MFILAALTAVRPACGAGDTTETRLLFSPAPVGQWGGMASGEYDRRWLGNDLVEVKRFLLRLGGTPSRFGTLWLEVGVAAMDLTTGPGKIEGQYGVAAGAGWTATLPGLEFRGVLPFVSGRATYFQTFVVNDETSENINRTIDRRYVWQEAFGVVGACRRWKKFSLHGGIALRALFQDEFRKVSAYSAVTKRQYVYKSGVKPGAIGAVMIPLEGRLTVWIAAEVFNHAQKLTVTFGQWGPI